MTKAEILAKIEEYKNDPTYVGLGYQLSEIIARLEDKTHNRVVYRSEILNIRKNLLGGGAATNQLANVLGHMLKL